MFLLSGFVFTLLALVSDLVGQPSYCDLETKFCNKGKHVACQSGNHVPIKLNESLDNKTRQNFLETINKHRNYKKIEWDSELENLLKLVDWSAKNICFISQKFVDITPIKLKYCGIGDDFFDSILTSNAIIQNIGCTIESGLNPTKCYFLDCLFNFSNRSTIIEYEGKIQAENALHELNIDAQNATRAFWNCHLFILIFVCVLMGTV